MCRMPSRQPSRGVGVAVGARPQVGRFGLRRIVAQPGTQTRTRTYRTEVSRDPPSHALHAGNPSLAGSTHPGSFACFAPLGQGISAIPASGFLPKRGVPGNARPAIPCRSRPERPQSLFKFSILPTLPRNFGFHPDFGRVENQDRAGDETRDRRLEFAPESEDFCLQTAMKKERIRDSMRNPTGQTWPSGV